MHFKAYLKGGDKMDEYISREFVLSCVDDFLRKTDMPIAAQYFYDCFRECEAADVQPVKHGRWKQIGEQSAKCTACGGVLKSNGKDKTGKALIFNAVYHYCPYCGARIDLKGNENDKNRID